MNSLSINYNELNSLPLKYHCKKCGRRHRNSKPYTNIDRIKRNRQHCCHQTHSIKYRKERRLFPNQLPLYSTNNHHLTSINQNLSRKSNQNNVLIDQFIQIQPLNTSRCNNQIPNYHHYVKNNNDQIGQYQKLRIKHTLERVQPMIYLRENINKQD